MASMASPENIWIKFFQDAGLPSNISATYALTFIENRIQMNMLLDLNKEYLREMGITCMGDVIAILRHAKQVHEEVARERVLGIIGPKVPVAAVTGRPGVPKANTPAIRMLEHYTRNTPANVSPSNSVASVKERLGNLRIAATKRKVASPSDSSVMINSVEHKREEGISAVKHLRKAISQQTVFDDISADGPVTNKNNSNVFSRLGSNEEPRISNNITSRITITGLKQDIVKPSKTIFARLGDKDTEETSARRDSADSNEPLKYEGILKCTPPSKNIVIKSSTISDTVKISRGTMRADEVPISVREKLPLSHPQRKSVKFSPLIDYKEIEKRPTDNIILHNSALSNVRTVALSKSKTVFPSKKIVKRPLNPTNVKMRLGKTNLSTKIIKTRPGGVFGRLGVTSKI